MVDDAGTAGATIALRFCASLASTLATTAETAKAAACWKICSGIVSLPCAARSSTEERRRAPRALLLLCLRDGMAAAGGLMTGANSSD